MLEAYYEDVFADYTIFSYIYFDGSNIIYKRKIHDHSIHVKPLLTNIRWDLLGGVIYKKNKNKNKNIWTIIGRIYKTGKIELTDTSYVINEYLIKNLNSFERKLKLEKLLKS